MTLFVAPAAAGKTAYVLHLVRGAARGLGSTPRIIVPTNLQVRAWRRRLAEVGGAIGVRVMTFDRLYAECLNAAGEAYTELSEPVQYCLVHGHGPGCPVLDSPTRSRTAIGNPTSHMSLWIKSCMPA